MTVVLVFMRVVVVVRLTTALRILELQDFEGISRKRERENKTERERANKRALFLLKIRVTSITITEQRPYWSWSLCQTALEIQMWQIMLPSVVGRAHDRHKSQIPLNLFQMNVGDRLNKLKKHSHLLPFYIGSLRRVQRARVHLYRVEVGREEKKTALLHL